MSTEIELVSIRYENIRGFYDTTLPLMNQKTLIIGRNHAGKTSALLLLAWLFNDANPDLLLNNVELNTEEQDFLLPARSARHRARRITLKVHIPDGRTAKKFKAADDNNVLLRVGFRVSGVPTAFIQLGKAHKSSESESDPRSKELLSLIQDIYSVVHIPSARDAESAQFQSRFRTLYRNRLAERALHPKRQSGSTTEYKQIVHTTRALKKLAETLLTPMLEELSKSLPSGLLESPKLVFKERTEQSVVDWIVEQVVLKLVTGKHDDTGVAPSDVGAGLQSVLDIAAASVILGEGGNEKNKKLIVAVEEPEAFLHPSLQRVIARKLLSEEYGYKTLVSTHSSILVQEAKYEDILLAVDGKIRVPKREDEIRRSEIHTALLNAQGAEMIFASSVLLVEGEGDRAFFEGLRRRLAKQDQSGRVDNLFVVQVGSNTSFGPWVKLLRALNDGNAPPPFTYLVVPDGDATSEASDTLKNSNVSIPANARVKLKIARDKLKAKDYEGWRAELNEANDMLSKSDPPVPLCFLEGDLEWAIFSDLSSEECEQWVNSFNDNNDKKIDFIDKDTFIKTMGSKAVDGKGGEKYKAPYMRKQVAVRIKLRNLSQSVRLVIQRWLMNAEFTKQEAENLMN